MKNNYLKWTLIAGFLLSLTIPVHAGWTIDSLSANRASMVSVTIGDRAIFSNGYYWDIYDKTNQLWTTGNFWLSRNEIYPVANGGKAYFAGGWRGPYTNPVDVNNVEVYTALTNSWSTLTLSQARRVGAGAAIGNKVIFAGGYKVLAYSNRVDIFDVVSNVRTTALLSQARTNISVGVNGSKVVFAGGQKGQATMGVINSSDRVDIYDDILNTWSTATISSKRQQMSVAVIGSKILFAGGINMASGVSSNNVDVYDVITNTWTVQHLTQKKYSMTSAVVGTRAYFFGGVVNSSGTLSSRVEIYDASTGLWSVKYLTGPHHAGVVSVTSERIMYAGGIEVWGNTGTDKVEVFTISTGKWSVEHLSQPRLSLCAASLTNTAIFAGGNQVWSSYPIYTIPSKRVDIWTDSLPLRIENLNAVSTGTLLLYPNPAESTVSFKISGTELSDYTYGIWDMSGRVILQPRHSNDSFNEINIDDLPSGIYVLKVDYMNGEKFTSRFVKK